MKRYIVALTLPLLVLLVATVTACVLGYLMAWGLDDPSALRKIIIRITQLFLLLSIFPVTAYLKLTKEDLGFTSRPKFLKQLPLGFGLGLVTLSPVLISEYLLGISVFDEAQPWTFSLAIKKTTLSLLLALLIAVVEELVFRGMLLASLKKVLPNIAAILICSSYFAALHFLDSNAPIAEHEFTLLSAFGLLAKAVGNVFNPQNIPAFFSLLAVGIFLAVLRTEVKASLGLCIGCHAGWAWLIKMNGSVFNANYGSEYVYLISSINNVIGHLATGWLGFAIICYFVYKKVPIKT